MNRTVGGCDHRSMPEPTPDRRRLDEIFGDTLPDTTSDERDDRDRAESNDDSDEWLRENRPPHW